MNIVLFQDEGVEDTLSRTEQVVDEQLEANDVLVEQVSELKRMDTGQARQELRFISEDPDDSVEDVKVWIPDSTEEQLSFSRYWNRRVSEYITEQYASAYHDRLDRLEVKQQVLKHVTDSQTPTHEVAQDIVNADMSGYASNTDTLENRFKTDEDLNLVDMLQLPKSELPNQKNKTQRLEMLVRGFRNSDYNHRERLVNMTEKIFDLEDGNRYADAIEDRFDISYESHIEAADVDEFAPSVVDTFAAETPEQEAQLVDRILEWCEVQQGATKVTANQLSDHFRLAGLVDNPDDTEAIRREIQSLDNEHGLDNFRTIHKNKIVLPSHIQ